MSNNKGVTIRVCGSKEIVNATGKMINVLEIFSNPRMEVVSMLPLESFMDANHFISCLSIFMILNSKYIDSFLPVGLL
jgi:hypothetical protein